MNGLQLSGVRDLFKRNFGGLRTRSCDRKAKQNGLSQLHRLGSAFLFPYQLPVGSVFTVASRDVIQVMLEAAKSAE